MTDNKETILDKVDNIFSPNYHPDCHPSRSDDVKAQEAIKLLAKEMDKLKATIIAVLNM